MAGTKRGRRKFSNFRNIRVHRVGLNEEKAAGVLGVSIEDIRRWDYEAAPPMAERLLLLWDRYHVGFPGWEGFVFSRGVLMFRGRRWRPETLRLDSWQSHESLRLRYELDRLYSWGGVLRIVRRLSRQAWFGLAGARGDSW